MPKIRSFIPVGATHIRDDDQFYKVTNKVQYFEYGEWHDANDCYDLKGWLEELSILES